MYHVRQLSKSRTLMVLPLTEIESVHPPELVIKRVRNIKDAFEHFQPFTEVVFSRNYGQEAKEGYKFQSLNDFDLAKRTEQSLFLNSINNPNDLEKHLSSVREKVEVLARNYYTLASFFAYLPKPELSIIYGNIEIHPEVILKQTANALSDAYIRLGNSELCSLLVVPGYIQSETVFEALVDFAASYGLLFIADLPDFTNIDELKPFQKTRKYGGIATKYCHALICYNWISKENSNLFYSPSSALAAQISITMLAQPTAGYRYGKIQYSGKVKHQLLRSEVNEIDDYAIPFISGTKDFTGVFAYGCRTLYRGEELSFQFYSTSRLLSWIAKCVINYFTEIWFNAFEDFQFKKIDSRSLESQLQLHNVKRETCNFLKEMKRNNEIRDFSVISLGLLMDDLSQRVEIEFRSSFKLLYQNRVLALKILYDLTDAQSHFTFYDNN